MYDWCKMSKCKIQEDREHYYFDEIRLFFLPIAVVLSIFTEKGSILKTE